jgi:hypothetical protein
MSSLWKDQSSKSGSRSRKAADLKHCHMELILTYFNAVINLMMKLLWRMGYASRYDFREAVYAQCGRRNICTIVGTDICISVWPIVFITLE